MIDQSRLVRLFEDLVAIDSPSLGERSMCRYINKVLDSLGIRAAEDGAAAVIGGDCGNLLAFLEGVGEPVLFCVHMDTVEPSRGKRAVVHGDGRITSAGDTVLGADDMAGVAAILEALRVIREQELPHRPIELLFTAAEELYCIGSAAFDAGVLQAREAYILDLTGPVGTAAYRAPSIVSFRAEVRGRTAHAGFAPETGIHAVQVASAAVAGIRLGRIDSETTVNIGTIEGGNATNIVPDICAVTGEIRSYSHEKAMAELAGIEGAFRAACESAGAAVEVTHKIPCEAYETDRTHPVVRRFERACGELGLPVSLIETFGGSDLNNLAVRGIPGLVIANAMNACHSCDEYTTVEELGRIAELTLCLMCAAD